ncbi:hypothetical protein BASA81_000567 [Batrachochytrium salamandrivorans]|nr:hypothetical protein BASA81_000567 [Batrachochytrium salamandrivorans]
MHSFEPLQQEEEKPSPTKHRLVCYGAVLFFVLLLVLFLLPVALQSHQSCDSSLSASYSSGNRTVSYEMCALHLLTNNPEFTSKEPDEITFLVFGDFGRDGFCCQRDVAWEMHRAAAGLISFVVNTGDSFYVHGLRSAAKDEQVNTSFAHVYTTLGNLAQVPFYSVLGNHDYLGSAPEVLKLNHTTQLRMDGRFYSRTFSQPDTGVVVLVVFLDTNPMIESYKQRTYDDHISGVLPNQMLHDEDFEQQWGQKVDEQVAFLEHELNHSSAHFNIVVGHHPIYSKQFAGMEDRSTLYERISPLLDKYRVDLYLSGHEHNLQAVRVNFTLHLVSGAGSKMEPSNGHAKVDFYQTQSGFFHVSLLAGRRRPQVTAVDLWGKTTRL